VAIINSEHHEYQISEGDQGWSVRLGDKVYQIAGQWQAGEPLFRATVTDASGAQQPLSVQMERQQIGYKMYYRGQEIDALVVTPRGAELQRLMPEKTPPDMSKYLLSPMPGLLVRLAVAEGDQVKAGEELAVVEAMKMENSLRAVHDGTVAKISADQGESLVVDQVILEFE
jgi:propionyl-CoA carboxylase alpha chain